MTRVQVVLLNDVDAEVGRLDQDVDQPYEVNDLVEHPDDGDLWVVCAVEAADAPYAQRATWVYVGRNAEPHASAPV